MRYAVALVLVILSLNILSIVYAQDTVQSGESYTPETPANDQPAAQPAAQNTPPTKDEIKNFEQHTFDVGKAFTDYQQARIDADLGNTNFLPKDCNSVECTFTKMQSLVAGILGKSKTGGSFSYFNVGNDKNNTPTYYSAVKNDKGEIVIKQNAAKNNTTSSNSSNVTIAPGTKIKDVDCGADAGAGLLCYNYVAGQRFGCMVEGNNAACKEKDAVCQNNSSFCDAVLKNVDEKYKAQQDAQKNFVNAKSALESAQNSYKKSPDANTQKLVDAAKLDYSNAQQALSNAQLVSNTVRSPDSMPAEVKNQIIGNGVPINTNNLAKNMDEAQKKCGNDAKCLDDYAKAHQDQGTQPTSPSNSNVGTFLDAYGGSKK